MVRHTDKHKLLKNELDNNSKFREYLFCKGFLISDLKDKPLSLTSYPFYGNWNTYNKNGFTFYVHKELNCSFYETDNRVFFMLGYALNSFSGELLEDNILKSLSEKNDIDFWKYESELTGVYVAGYIEKKEQTIYHWTDCAGMRIAYYGSINGNYFITSHTEILGYLFDLEEDSYVTELKTIKYFNLLGAYLPSEISTYKELRRTIPNHIYSSKGMVKRFFPFEKVSFCKSNEGYLDVVEKSSKILTDTMICCASKWSENNKAISLTGGKDSGVTFACSKYCFDKFSYFSYISKDAEIVDADAAKQICDNQLLDHFVINIPKDYDKQSFNLMDSIIYCNNGFVGRIKENEVRKRLYFIEHPNCDLEIKSWVDEISRAYYNKRFLTKHLPKRPNSKYLSSFYKIFWFENKIFKKTCVLFSDYINKFMNKDDLSFIEEWPILYSWEFGFSSLEGLNLISEHMLSQDIFIPFNCRSLMYIMIQPCLKDRISDRLQKDLIKKNNKIQYELDINIVNKSHTKFRARAERLYLFIMTHFVF